MKQRIFSVMITAAAAGLALSGCDSTPQATDKPAPPVKTTTSTSQPARPAALEPAERAAPAEQATTAARPQGLVLHPDRLGELRLGMSLEEANLLPGFLPCGMTSLESGD